MADAYAIAHNKFWRLEDNKYDYEEDTFEHKTACAVSDEWSALMNEYKKRIFETLTSEGVAVTATDQNKVLKLFMARFGYADSNGWWVKHKHKAK